MIWTWRISSVWPVKCRSTHCLEAENANKYIIIIWNSHRPHNKLLRKSPDICPNKSHVIIPKSNDICLILCEANSLYPSMMSPWNDSSPGVISCLTSSLTCRWDSLCTIRAPNCIFCFQGSVVSAPSRFLADVTQWITVAHSVCFLESFVDKQRALWFTNTARRSGSYRYGRYQNPQITSFIAIVALMPRRASRDLCSPYEWNPGTVVWFPSGCSQRAATCYRLFICSSQACPDGVRGHVNNTEHGRSFLPGIPVLQWAPHATREQYQRLSRYPGAHGWQGVDYNSEFFFLSLCVSPRTLFLYELLFLYFHF